MQHLHNFQRRTPGASPAAADVPEAAAGYLQDPYAAQLLRSLDGPVDYVIICDTDEDVEPQEPSRLELLCACLAFWSPLIALFLLALCAAAYADRVFG